MLQRSCQWNRTFYQKGDKLEEKDEFPDLNFRPGRQVGLIAQEVKEVLPEVVFEDSQGMQGVAYSAIIPVLFEAIKEQQKIIEEQGEKLSKLDEIERQLQSVQKVLQNTSTNGQLTAR